MTAKDRAVHHQSREHVRGRRRHRASPHRCSLAFGNVALDARTSPAIQRLLGRIPEFSATFDRFVEEEEGEFGSFWAMNELSRWALPQDDPNLVARVFAAVEDVYSDDSLPDGHDLAIEFFESVCEAGRERFDGYIGIGSREWFERYGW